MLELEIADKVMSMHIHNNLPKELAVTIDLTARKLRLEKLQERLGGKYHRLQ